MSLRREWTWLVILIFLGSILRIQAISTTELETPIRADARDYYFAAFNLKYWQTFSIAPPASAAPAPDAVRPPVIPVLIATIIEPMPAEGMLFRFNLFQTVLDTLTILFSFLLFRQLGKPVVALGAAFLVALSPHLIVMTTYLLTETTFTFLVAGGVLAGSLALVRSSTGWAAGAGILFGLSALTRSTTEFFPLFLLIFLFPLTDRQTFRRAVVPIVLGALLIIGSWKLRNFLSTGALSDPTLTINTVLHGMYPDFMYNGDPQSLGVPYRFDPFASHVGSLGDVLGELWRRASTESWQYLRWYLFDKPVALLSWKLVDGAGDIFVYPPSYSPYFDRPLFVLSRLLMYWLHALLSIAAVAGFVLSVVKPRWLGLTGSNRYPALLMTAVVAFFIAVHVAGFPLARYGIPLRPYVYGFGLFALVYWGELFWAKLRAQPTTHP